MLIVKPTSEVDAFSLGGTSNIRLETFNRNIGGLLVQVLGTNNVGGDELDAANAIEHIVIEQDTKQKVYIEPSLQRKLDNCMNANADTLSPSFVFVPFLRMGIAGSAWGTANIAQLLAKIKIKSAAPAGGSITGVKAWMSYIPLAQPVNRGSVYVQTVYTPPMPAQGWNTISDLPYQGIISLTKMIMADDYIDEVRVLVGDRVVYHMNKSAAKFALQVNPLHKVPSTFDFFPVMLDALGNPGDFLPLFEGGVRQTVRVEYNWTNATLRQFKILLEGIERDDQAPVITAKA